MSISADERARLDVFRGFHAAKTIGLAVFLDLDRHRVALRRYHHIGGQQRHAEPPFAIASRGQRHAVDPDRLLAADSFQRQPAPGLRRMEYAGDRSEEHTSELQSLMRTSY